MTCDIMAAKNWDKTLYKNWVRGAKGLEYLQEGLQDFVGDKVLESRNLTLQQITNNLPAGSCASCSQCTRYNLLPEHADLNKSCSRKNCIQELSSHCFGSKPKDRRKCPNGLCSKLYDAIVQDHQSTDPLWKNTDPSTWCSDPSGWSFAKCFETTPGPGASAKETDAAGLLSIVINNFYFRTWLACPDMDSNTKCPFYKAREIRNTILHSAKMELDDQALDDYIETFKTVLKDPKCLVSYAESQVAINKLTQLKSKQISISLEEEEIILRQRQESLLELDEEKSEALREIGKRKSEVLQEIEASAKKAKTEAVEEIGEIKKDILSETEVAKSAAIEAKKAKTEVVEEIGEIKKDVLSEIEVAKSAAIEELSSRKSNEAGPSGEETVHSVKSTAISELKEDLIELYRTQYTNIPLSPLMEEEDTHLLDFCVMPELHTVELQRALGGGKEIKTCARSLHDVFYKKGKICRNIYLSADAGLGKTVFSKRLALIWCQAHKTDVNEIKYFSTDEIQVMKEFEYLFLVFLRDSSDKCDIDDMILSQIIRRRLAHSSILLNDLENLMSKAKCLVILDGLDEWSHGVPNRKARACTILTTTRPWKLSEITLKSSEIDRRVELVGLKKGEKQTLKLKVISLLCGVKDERQLEKLEEDFTKAVILKDISDLETIPLILMYLLCLWCERIDLGQGQSELYSCIIELLLSRTVEKYKELQVEAEYAAGDIPQCLSKQKLSKKYYTLLKALGQLAFETLFDESRENTLVFDSSVAENYLNEEYLKFFFFSGIITQHKVRKLTSKESRVSFAHKTLQEYFAALYLQSTANQNSVRNKVRSKCKSIKDILEMSKVIIFLSGIDADIASSVSSALLEKINGDEISCTYRGMPSSYYFDKYVQPLKNLQEMCITGVKENPREDDLTLPLQDIFINKQCQQEGHRQHLQRLTKKNKKHIKSVCIEMEGLPFNVEEVLQFFAISEMNNIEKIYYRGEVNECNIKPLLHEELKCISIISSTWQGNHFVDAASSCSAKLSDTLCSLNKLEALYINGFKMCHDQINMLIGYVTSRTSMREVMLLSLECTDHDASCPGCSLDLSEHSSLRTLALAKLPLSALEINVSSLEDCEIGHLSKHGLVSHYLKSLEKAQKLITFTCSYLESSEDINTMLDTLRSLTDVKDIWLWDIDLGEKALTLSPGMKNIVYLRLRGVKMTCSSFRDLLNVVEKLPRSVTVYMRDCTITPENEFEKMKQYIQTSEHFIVTYDDVYKNGKVTEFKTIKDQD